MIRRLLLQPFLLLTNVLFVGLLATVEWWKDDDSPYRWWFAPLAFALAASGEVLRAFPRTKHPSRRKELLLEKTFAHAFEQLRKIDPSLRINVMEATLRWKQFWWGRCFSFVKAFGFTNQHTDGDLVLFKDQGVAGTVLSRGKWAVGRRDKNEIKVSKDVLSGIDRGLSDEQREMVANLGFICCYPIRALAKKGVELDTKGPLIGVVCIDSTRSAQEWHDQGHLEELLQQWLPDLATASSCILEC